MSPGTSVLGKLSGGFPPKQPRSWLGMLLLMQAFLLVNGPALVGPLFPTSVANYYLLLTLIPLVLDDRLKHELLKGTVREYAMKFAAGWGSTVLLYWLLFIQFTHPEQARIALQSVWPMITLQLFFVAPAEELFFRGYMPRLFDPQNKSWRAKAKMYAGISLASAGTAAVFSSFHYAALGGFQSGFVGFFLLFLLAMVWLFLSRFEVGRPFHSTKKPLGIPFTMGSHFGWNLCALGIITGGVIVGM